MDSNKMPPPGPVDRSRHLNMARVREVRRDEQARREKDLQLRVQHEAERAEEEMAARVAEAEWYAYSSLRCLPSSQDIIFPRQQWLTAVAIQRTVMPELKWPVELKSYQLSLLREIVDLSELRVTEYGTIIVVHKDYRWAVDRWAVERLLQMRHSFGWQTIDLTVDLA